MKHSLVIFTCLCLAACASRATAPEIEPVVVQYTFAAQPWLGNLSDCSGQEVITPELRAVDYIDLENSDLALRLGDTGLNAASYQVGEEEVVVIVNPQNPAAVLTSTQVLALFTGLDNTWKDINGLDTPVQVWGFSGGEELQRIFEQTALQGSPFTSNARLAVSPEDMRQAVAGDVNAVGLLTRRWLTDEVTAAYTAAAVPVLALVPSSPDASVLELISCMQQ